MARSETIDQFYQRVADWAASNHDDYAMTRSLRYGEDNRVQFAPEGLGQLFGGAVTASTAKPTDHAFRQLCGMMNVPAGWAGDEKDCPSELRSHILNWKLERAKNNRLFVRQRTEGEGETVLRALLSDQYVAFDNVHLVTAVKNAIEMNGIRVTVLRPEVGDKMRAYLLLDEYDFSNVRPGTEDGADGGGSGGLKPALYLHNFELGGGSLGVHGGLYRSYCGNGAIFGWQQTDVYTLAHRWKSPALMANMVNNAITSALRLTEKAAIAFLEAQEYALPVESIESVISGWAGRFSIPSESTQQLIGAAQAQAGSVERFTRYDLINEATYLASRTENGDVREQMEVMAGAMILDWNGRGTPDYLTRLYSGRDAR